MLVRPIEIKLTYPFTCRLEGPSLEELDFKVKFEEANFHVEVTMETEAAQEIKTGDQKGLHFCETKNLLVHLTSDSFLGAFRSPVSDLNKDGDFKKNIYQISLRILNRVLRNLRTYGIAPQIRQQPPSEQEAEAFLWSWRTEFRIGDGPWQPLEYKQDVVLMGFLARNVGQGWGYWPRTPEISTYLMRDITEAIEDDRTPPPEQEFWVNALEFLYEQNFRMAVVESAIGLEIVLTELLTLVLQKKKKLAKSEIEDFLIRVGLKKNLNVVLPLAIDDKDLTAVDFEAVSKVITWRNHVVHDGSQLQDVPDSQIQEAIQSVVAACEILRLKIHQINSLPVFQSIAEKVKQNSNSLFCWVLPVTERKIHMDLTLPAGSCDLTKHQVEEIVNICVGLLGAHIPRFDPKQDLYAKIHGLSRLQPFAVYSKGEVRIVEPTGQPT